MNPKAKMWMWILGGLAVVATLYLALRKQGGGIQQAPSIGQVISGGADYSAENQRLALAAGLSEAESAREQTNALATLSASTQVSLATILSDRDKYLADKAVQVQLGAQQSGLQAILNGDYARQQSLEDYLNAQRTNSVLNGVFNALGQLLRRPSGGSSGGSGGGSGGSVPTRPRPGSNIILPTGGQLDWLSLIPDFGQNYMDWLDINYGGNPSFWEIFDNGPNFVNEPVGTVTGDFTPTGIVLPTGGGFSLSDILNWWNQAPSFMPPDYLPPDYWDGDDGGGF